MSYHIYTTNGIILKRTAFAEANVFLHILTEDLGLIVASAQSARLAKSKLSGGLQEYSLVTISCVKGKNGWKVTSVLGRKNIFFNCPQYSQRILAQVGLVLLKMIPGVEPHRDIFETVSSGFEFLPSVPEEKISFFEILIVLRILYHLGYVVSDDRTKTFLQNTSDWNDNLLDTISLQKKEVVGLINKAFEESQL
ncbi:MAG: recombination protein O N-terminal domain-containing protein [bacterium]